MVLCDADGDGKGIPNILNVSIGFTKSYLVFEKTVASQKWNVNFEIVFLLKC